MPPKPPRSRRGPPVDAKRGQSRDDDEEVSKGTVQHSTGSILSRSGSQEEGTTPAQDPSINEDSDARAPALADRRRPKSVAVPVGSSPNTPSVHRGSRDIEFDPEASAKTNATVQAPDPIADEPSRSSSYSRSGVSRSGVSRSGLSKGGKSQNWVAPPGKMSRELSQPEYETGNNSAAQSQDGSDSGGYQTGNNYDPIVGEDEVSSEGRSLSLEGDGLDALDPEIDLAAHSKTRNLPPGELSDDEEAEDNHTHAGPPLKLEIVAGPDAGKRKKLKGVRFIIGRTPGVDLQLTDQSVSRRHVELVVGDGGVLLRDMGSGNGTKVNGEKVTEQILSHGDESGIGKTRIKFVDELGAVKKAREENEKKEKEEAEAEAAAIAAAAEGGEAQPEGDPAASGEAPPPGEGGEGSVVAGDPAASAGAEKDIGTDENPALSRGVPVQRRAREEKGLKGLLAAFMAMETKKKAYVGGGVAFIFLAVVLIIVMRPGAPPPQDPIKGMAVEKMQLARDAVRAERYEDAINLIDQAEKLVPGIDQTRLATQARNELSIVNALDDVRRLIDQKKFEDARAAIAKAPQGSVRTEEAKKRLSDQLAEAEEQYKKEHFQELISQGELDGAAQLMTEMSTDMRMQVQGTLEEAKAALEKSVKEEQRQEANAAAGRQARTKAQKAETMALAFAIVQRKFVGQEWVRASAECDRAVDSNPGDDEIRKRAKQLQNLIPNFGRNYEEGKKKFIAGQIESSVKPLRKAWELYQQIDFQTPMGEEIKEKLAEASLFAGKEALLREDLGSAAVDFREAVRLAPEDAKAKQLLQEVTNRADEVYQQAYMIRDRDPKEALKQFKTVLEITPPGSTVHEKAKNQVNSMEP